MNMPFLCVFAIYIVVYATVMLLATYNTFRLYLYFAGKNSSIDASPVWFAILGVGDFVDEGCIELVKNSRKYLLASIVLAGFIPILDKFG